MVSVNFPGGHHPWELSPRRSGASEAAAAQTARFGLESVNTAVIVCRGELGVPSHPCKVLGGEGGQRVQLGDESQRSGPTPRPFLRQRLGYLR